MAHQRPIDKEFEDADDTGVLVLSSRNLRSFPVGVGADLVDYSEIVEADFSKNRFDRLPVKQIISFKSLVSLNCHHNNLRFIPEELGTLAELRTVDFSRNFIQTVPPEICRMKLKSLNLSNNRLLSLPLEFGKLTDLKYLNLSCNSIQELPPSFSELLMLQHSDIHRNELRDLPEDLYQLTELEFLDVSSNQINRLPPSLRLLTAIREIKVMDNPLESPPSQLCLRGLVHIFKFLEEMEKKGSDSSLASTTSRDSSMRRMRQKQRTSLTRPMSESTPIKNGGHIGLLDDITTYVNKTFGDGETTPTGSLHWSVAQYMNDEKPTSPGDQSRDDYREAAQRLYNQQEKQRGKTRTQRSQSPPLSSEGGSNTLPKRKTSEEGGLEVRGRSLPGERQPRPGSWNSHIRNAKPVLPNKYSATPPTERSKSASVSSDDRSPVVTRPHSEVVTPSVASPKITAAPKPVVPPKTSAPSNSPKRKPAPLDLPTTSSHEPEEREGSITPTNEEPPTLDSEPGTPTKTKKSPGEVVTIQELDGSPTLGKKRPELNIPATESADKLSSPRRRKEKDVFKFLKESDPNYTIRRQQLQMNLILEKNQHVKKAVEGLLGVELADDVGEWVADGVILCKLVNKLHPGTITTINTAQPGKGISRIKQTVNISAFIEACRKLKVPDEELCSAGDIIEMKDPIRVISCLQRVLETKQQENLV